MNIKRYKYPRTCALPIAERLVIGEKDKTKGYKSRSGRVCYPPKCLGYFRILKNIMDANGEYVIDQTFPKIQEVDVFLPNPIMEGGVWRFPFLESSLGCYQAGKEGGATLYCYGDGFKAHRIIDGKYQEIECNPEICPLSTGSGNEKPSCKAQGRIYFFRVAQRTGGACLYRTRSYPALQQFEASLTLFANILMGQFQGVPFKLILYKEKTTTPPPESRSTSVWRVRLDGLPLEELEKYRMKAITQGAISRQIEAPPELLPVHREYEGEDLSEIEADEEPAVDENGKPANEPIPEPDVKGFADRRKSLPMPTEETDLVDQAVKFRFSPDEDEEEIACRLEFLCSQRSADLDCEPEDVLQELTINMSKSKKGTRSIKDFFTSKGADEKKHEASMAKLAELVKDLEAIP